MIFRPRNLIVAALVSYLTILPFSPQTEATGAVFSGQPSTAATAALPIPDSTFTDSLTPGPAGNVVARDLDNDAGGAISITWSLSADDREGGLVREYLILRSDAADGEFTELGNAARGESTFVDNQAPMGQSFYYKIAAVNFEQTGNEYVWRTVRESETIGPISSTAQWFNTGRLNILIGILLICGATIYYIMAAKSGKTFYIRKIAGIEEVENAVGRATEMGKTIYYVPGIHDMDDVQTLASMAILGRVAHIAAQNNTRIDVPVNRSMVMVTAKETVREAYGKAGRPDAYMDDQVRYLTDDQFGYAAAVDGLFVREKPGTIFLIGAFFAEALIMAETGNSIGAIQIAGTAQPAQLPFFVAACDYTLIGEELFAASAYLSREPKLLGSLKGQDFGKALFLIAIIVGIILEMFGIPVAWLFSV
ncbi:MAG: hypothetical protein PHR28_03065 [candidate division Zixibacteria bacterium]|nr:hypothetical protein [candidate division Zixibacteria bacterium]